MPEPILRLHPRPLEGRHVRLEPYQDSLKPEVRAALDCDAEAWDLITTSGQGEHFEGWWANAMREVQAGGWISYAVRRLSDGRVVGTTSFLNIRPARGCVEIGATFFHPDVRSGAVNPDSKRLLLTEAFDGGALRVELVTDLRNLRSQAAIAKLGAVREGVLRRDRVTWTGHVRDTVMSSITDLEWPAVRAGLDARLAS